MTDWGYLSDDELEEAIENVDELIDELNLPRDQILDKTREMLEQESYERFLEDSFGKINRETNFWMKISDHDLVEGMAKVQWMVNEINVPGDGTLHIMRISLEREKKRRFRQVKERARMRSRKTLKANGEKK